MAKATIKSAATAKAPSPVAGKTTPIHIALETHDALKVEAMRLGVSIGEACGRLVTTAVNRRAAVNRCAAKTHGKPKAGRKPKAEGKVAPKKAKPAKPAQDAAPAVLPGQAILPVVTAP